MRLSFRIKHHFFNAFREFFVHHHGSLEFRAKVFALIIAVNNSSADESYILVQDIGLRIYNNNERADLLMLTTKEKVIQLTEERTTDIDTLVNSILHDLKIVPRYAKKINLEELRELLPLTADENILCYQENILEFLEKLKNETLQSKEEQINKDELILNSEIKE